MNNFMTPPFIDYLFFAENSVLNINGINNFQRHPPLPQVKTKDVFGGNIWCFVGQGLGDKDNGTTGE